MRTSSRGNRTWRLTWSWAVVGITTVPALCVVFIASPGDVADALLPAFSSAVAMAAWCLPWPVRAVSFPMAVGAMSVVSLVVDLSYRGPTAFATVWFPVELIALLMVTGWIVRRTHPRPVGWFVALLALVVVAQPLRFASSEDPLPWPGVAFLSWTALVLLGVAVAVALYLRVQDDRRRAAAIEAHRAQRLRIARDLHDFVAHEVTEIVLEVQLAHIEAHDPPTIRALHERIEDAGQRALTAMDDMVHALDDGDGPAQVEAVPINLRGLADLPDLVRRFSAVGRARATLDVAPCLVDTVPREIEALIHRIATEALTNVRTHAEAATAVAVRVSMADGATLMVSVTNDGTGARTPRRRRPGGGTGLARLAEQVEAFGGRLTAGPHDLGWQVAATLPL